MSENTQNNDLNPDDLLTDFRSKGLFPIIIFTFVIHGVVLLGSSVPWMYDSLFSSVDESASEEERIKEAVREATGSLKDIADKYGIHPEELSSQFSKKDKKGSAPVTSQERKNSSTSGKADQSQSIDEGNKPKSSIEKEIGIKAKGPALPSIPKEKEEDLFK
jgi:hypothetical protein